MRQLQILLCYISVANASEDTRLADRTAALEAERAGYAPPSGNESIAGPALKVGVKSQTGDVPLGPNQSKLRVDLAEALRSKGQLQSRLKAAEEELEKNKAKMKADARSIKELSSEKALLALKVRDRDEELKGKARLLEVSLYFGCNNSLTTKKINMFQEVQDEMISLNLQVNVSEKRAKDLKNENEDLVARWMRRMRQEADAMNDASKFS